jgi:hypothetical protein
MPLIDVVKRVIHCSFSYLRTQRAWRVEAPPPNKSQLEIMRPGAIRSKFSALKDAGHFRSENLSWFIM